MCPHGYIWNTRCPEKEVTKNPWSRIAFIYIVQSYKQNATRCILCADNRLYCTNIKTSCMHACPQNALQRNSIFWEPHWYWKFSGENIGDQSSLRDIWTHESNHTLLNKQVYVLLKCPWNIHQDGLCLRPWNKQIKNKTHQQQPKMEGKKKKDRVELCSLTIMESN